VASRFCERAISCDERCIQRLRKSEIRRVVSRQAVPHLPDALEQHEMGIAGERKVGEVGESFRAALSGDGARALISAQDLRNFEIDQMRSMQRLVRCKKVPAHAWRYGRLQ